MLGLRPTAEPLFSPALAAKVLKTSAITSYQLCSFPPFCTILAVVAENGIVGLRTKPAKRRSMPQSTIAWVFDDAWNGELKA